MSRHDVVKRHDFRSAMKSKEKLSSMKSVRFDGIYTGKEAEVGHGGVCPYIYIYVHIQICKPDRALNPETQHNLPGMSPFGEGTRPPKSATCIGIPRIGLCGFQGLPRTPPKVSKIMVPHLSKGQYSTCFGRPGRAFGV